jgi:hypothetical protein
MKRLATAFVILLAASVTASAGDSGGFGFGAGSVKVKDVEGSHLWLTANLRTMLHDYVALEPEVGWYRESVGGFSMNVFNTGGSLLLVLPARKFDVFGGAGLGAHIYRYSEEWRSIHVAVNTTRLGYHFMGGADLIPTNTISLFGVVRYEIVTFDEVDVKQWKVYGGLRFRAH